MRVIILAPSIREAETHRKWAKLSPRDCHTAMSAASFMGLRLDDEDLIVELPGFREKNRQADEILVALQMSMKKGGVPRWERITG